MKLLRKFHWFELVIIVVVMGVHFYTAFSAPHNFPSRWFTRDDAYYYFKVAQNISEGRGSTFDGINLTNGYHPLWMLVCIPIFALARYDLILPLRILMLVMAVISAGTSILIFRVLIKEVGLPGAMLASSIWAFSLEIHSVVTQQGMETGVFALSVVLFLILLKRLEQNPDVKHVDLVYLALAGLFVLFCRLDGIYLILIAGVWQIFRRYPIRYLLPLDLIFTFSIIVGAFIQRATLIVYLGSFDESAIVIAAITFVIQTVVFYFTGLYARPASIQPLRIFILSAVGVGITTLLTAPLMFLISSMTKYDLPRLVPVLYFGGMLALTFFSRLALRAISPWPVTLSKNIKPSEGFLAGKSHVRAAFEPLARWFNDGIIYFGIVAAGLLTYLGLNRILFGTFMPVSGQIKRWWGTLPNDVYGGPAQTVLDVYGLDPLNTPAWSLLTNPITYLAKKLSAGSWNFDGWYWSILTIIIFTLIVIFLINRRKSLPVFFKVGIIPLLMSAQFQVFMYGALAYSAKQEWYWVMQMLALIILAGAVFSAVFELIPPSFVFRQISNLLVGLVGIYLVYTFAFELVTRMPMRDPQAGEPYMDTLPILEGYTEPGAIIGMTGGGNTGYFIRNRTIINMDGLINSYSYFQAVQKDQGGKFLAKEGMEYIFAKKFIITSSLPYSIQYLDSELTAVPGAPVYGQKELMRYIPAK